MMQTDKKPERAGGHQFGTFGGVFTPSILTILGVIMFMRAGFVVGRAGVHSALLILVLATAITFLTGLSISAIATNTRMRGGGAYFMISRVLGPEFGGAIGLALFLAQALSVPFYILGFVEALTRSFPPLQEHFFWLAMGTAVVLFIVVIVGAHWAIRVQFLILAVLAASIVTFLGGMVLHFDAATFHRNIAPAPGFNFWIIFAIYFPSVTGIMAGVNMSGDLKDPARSIPRGTLAAIGVGFAVYATQILLSAGAEARETLIAQPYRTLLQHSLLGMGFLVMAGVFAATVSSAIGSFMGAPRVLQALSRDRIFGPLHIFAAGARRADEPRRALILTFGMTLLVLWYAGAGGGGSALNLVALIVSMFFLYTYGMTNLAAFVESFGLNPSFRPRFKYFHWTTALAGAAGCAWAAFLIHPAAALGALVILGFLYFYVRSRVLEAAFGDARRGFFFARVRSNLFQLAPLPRHPKNWRPIVLALTGNPASRATLAAFANWLECGRGIVTLAEILTGDFQDIAARRDTALKRLETFIRRQNISAFPEVLAAPDFDEALTALLQVHSIGPLKPNLVMFGWPRDPGRVKPFARHLRAACALRMSLIVVRDRGLPPPRERARVDIWWRGQENGSLMLILAHLLRQNWEWARTPIRLLRAVENEQGREPAARSMHRLIEAARIPARVEVVVSNAPSRIVIPTHSSDAAVVFLGFHLPDDPSSPIFDDDYVAMLSHLPTTLLVASSGEADLLA